MSGLRELARRRAVKGECGDWGRELGNRPTRNGNCWSCLVCLCLVGVYYIFRQNENWKVKEERDLIERN
jgi:hypothetical protein